MFATKERVITLLNTDLSNKPTNVNRNMRAVEEHANTVHAQTYRENQINESYLSSLIIKHFIVANCHSGHIDCYKHHLSILTGGYIGMLLWSYFRKHVSKHIGWFGRNSPIHSIIIFYGKKSIASKYTRGINFNHDSIVFC